jgi:hypothetical protein
MEYKRKWRNEFHERSDDDWSLSLLANGALRTVKPNGR